MKVTWSTGTAAVGLPRRLAAHSLVRYLGIGLSSFIIDFGLLVGLRDLVGTPLWLATSVGFWASVIFNFLANRHLAFAASGGLHVHAARYGILLGANYLVTLLVVSLFARLGLGYQVGKVVAVAGTTCWNYLLYRCWVFGGGTAGESRAGRAARAQT